MKTIEDRMREAGGGKLTPKQEKFLSRLGTGEVSVGHMEALAEEVLRGKPTDAGDVAVFVAARSLARLVLDRW